MLEVVDAQRVVMQRVAPRGFVERTLGVDLLGDVLAEEVRSDLDMPPFDKAMMDGFAVHSMDFASGTVTLPIVGEIHAGQNVNQSLSRGQAIRIMTGSVMPPGADAVVMWEKCQSVDDAHVMIAGPIKPGLNVQPRGRELVKDQIVLRPGSVIRPAEIGLLAAVGHTRVRVFRRPRVAILSTGDELVPPENQPGPGQIRNSNGPMLEAQVASVHAEARMLGIASDDEVDLREKITRGLDHDVLILSGGVSAGKRDLVPDMMRELGVEIHVQKVRMKPGKPLVFGSRGDTLIFGLPGNPVSSFVGFELFVRPALSGLGGLSVDLDAEWLLPLAVEHGSASDRPVYHPARIVVEYEQEVVRPVEWLGSPDLKALAGANALLVIPPGEHLLTVGERLPVIRW